MEPCLFVPFSRLGNDTLSVFAKKTCFRSLPLLQEKIGKNNLPTYPGLLPGIHQSDEMSSSSARDDKDENLTIAHRSLSLSLSLSYLFRPVLRTPFQFPAWALKQLEKEKKFVAPGVRWVGVIVFFSYFFFVFNFSRNFYFLHFFSALVGQRYLP